jgi:hypothetical protein
MNHLYVPNNGFLCADLMSINFNMSASVKQHLLRFEVLTMLLRNRVSWDVMSCSQVDNYAV